MLVARARTRGGGRKGVVETVAFDGDKLLVLVIERVTEEPKREVERGGKHSILGFGTEDRN